MASLLRQLVASPRARHPEANLDLCYVTDSIIATSGPSGTYPQLAYRNPLKDLVKFLDSQHGSEWAIWEFRAEGTGYPDEEVYGRVRHYPWPDHHPPPFQLVPLIVGSMRNWLKSEEAEGKGRVVVVHCKAGKGRSGTASCSYLIAEEGWTPEQAMKRFTERRMRPGFGNGLSIPSQIRWIGYVDRWTRHGKVYMERPMEVAEVHVWGLRDGVKIAIEGFVEEGKVIKTFHTFQSEEREIVRGGILKDSGFSDVAMDLIARSKQQKIENSAKDVEEKQSEASDGNKGSGKLNRPLTLSGTEEGGDVIFRPDSRVVLPSSDINIDFERRNRSKYGGFTMVTSVAHVWFNTYFEGNGPENGGTPEDAGVFEIEWDAIDGIKGSSRKGTRAFDRVAVVWKTVDLERSSSVVINESKQGEEVEQKKPADWRGAKTQEGSQENIEGTVDAETPSGGERPECRETADNAHKAIDKKLGLRVESPDSRDISRASSLKTSNDKSPSDSVADEIEGVRSDVGPSTANTPHQQGASVAGIISGVRHISTEDLPGGVPEGNLDNHNGHAIGSLKLGRDKHSSS